MERKIIQTVIEDGESINAAWTNRIAISSYPVSGRASAWSPTITKVAPASDLSNETLNVYPTVICNRAWEVYVADVLSILELFTEFTGMAGKYNFEAWQTALIPLRINIYKGITQKHLVWQYNDGTATHPTDTEIINVTPNTAIGHTTWNELKGVVNFSHDVVYNCANSEQIIGGSETLTLLDETLLHNVDGNEVKYFIKELGCYVVNTGATVSVNDEELVADKYINKSDVLSMAHVIEPITHYAGQTKPQRRFVSIKLSDDQETEVLLEMGNVWNKPTWVNTDAGLQIAFSEISGWLF